MVILRFNRVLLHNIPQASDALYEVGDRVLVLREKQVDNRIGEGLGPFAVAGIDRERNLVYVSINPPHPAKAFGLAQVKKYLQSEQAAAFMITDLGNTLTSFMSDKYENHTRRKIFPTKVINAKDPRVSSNAMKPAEKI